MDRSPTEVNTEAWSRAEHAKRVLQRSRTAKAIGDKDWPSRVEPDIREAAKAAQNVRAAPDGEMHQARPENYDPGSIEERLAELGDEHIAQQMRRRLIGSQAPEPVMEVVGPSKAEGAAVTARMWAVDDEEFNKKAGDEMTDAEYEAVCKRMKPVHWDEDGNPDKWAPAHDRIAEDESLSRSVPTRREREQAKQYAVRALGSEGTGEHLHDTDHTILPDPYVEPVDPDLP